MKTALRLGLLLLLMTVTYWLISVLLAYSPSPLEVAVVTTITSSVVNCVSLISTKQLPVRKSLATGIIAAIFIGCAMFISAALVIPALTALSRISSLLAVGVATACCATVIFGNIAEAMLASNRRELLRWTEAYAKQIEGAFSFEPLTITPTKVGYAVQIPAPQCSVEFRLTDSLYWSMKTPCPQFTRDGHVHIDGNFTYVVRVAAGQTAQLMQEYREWLAAQ